MNRQGIFRGIVPAQGKPIKPVLHPQIPSERKEEEPQGDEPNQEPIDPNSLPTRYGDRHEFIK